MKYRSIMFTKNTKYPLALIKYTEEYKKYLEQIKRIDSSLSDSIEKCPKMYSELSEHQSYMIFLGENYCIGGINIATSCDEKNLEVEIGYDERYISLHEEMYEITDHIVDGLSYNFADKEKIEIILINNFELSKYNNKYTKIVYDEKTTTYTCINEYKNHAVKKKLEK